MLYSNLTKEITFFIGCHLSVICVKSLRQDKIQSFKILSYKSIRSQFVVNACLKEFKKCKD